MQTIDKQKESVSSMFNDIAPRYDFLNHFLSLGIDKIWRRKVRQKLPKNSNQKILDIATGTGDLAIELSKAKPESILGIDIAEKMVDIGKKKVEAKKLQKIIKLQTGDSLNIEFDDEYFDVATCSFGVRNFEDLNKGLSEIYRVLKNNGKIIILEFSKPNSKIFGGVFKLYFNKILPFFGKLISKNISAYTYLPNTVNTFPHGIEFLNILKKNGFTNTSNQKLSFGIANIYCGIKKIKT